MRNILANKNKDTKDKEENCNNCDLVNDVGLPLWANNDGYIFIKKHREFLESQKINEKINEWFNIIFGSKQKGNPAKKINNLYLEQTYEDFEEKYNKLSTEENLRSVQDMYKKNGLNYDDKKEQQIII